jgi:hypothetical protein
MPLRVRIVFRGESLANGIYELPEVAVEVGDSIVEATWRWIQEGRAMLRVGDDLLHPVVINPAAVETIEMA